MRYSTDAEYLRALIQYLGRSLDPAPVVHETARQVSLSAWTVLRVLDSYPSIFHRLEPTRERRPTWWARMWGATEALNQRYGLTERLYPADVDDLDQAIEEKPYRSRRLSKAETDTIVASVYRRANEDSWRVASVGLLTLGAAIVAIIVAVLTTDTGRDALAKQGVVAEQKAAPSSGGNDSSPVTSGARARSEPERPIVVTCNTCPSPDLGPSKSRRGTEAAGDGGARGPATDWQGWLDAGLRALGGLGLPALGVWLLASQGGGTLTPARTLASVFAFASGAWAWAQPALKVKLADGLQDALAITLLTILALSGIFIISAILTGRRLGALGWLVVPVALAGGIALPIVKLARLRAAFAAGFIEPVTSATFPQQIYAGLLLTGGVAFLILVGIGSYWLASVMGAERK